MSDTDQPLEDIISHINQSMRNGQLIETLRNHVLPGVQALAGSTQVSILTVDVDSDTLNHMISLPPADDAEATYSLKILVRYNLISQEPIYVKAVETPEQLPEDIIPEGTCSWIIFPMYVQRSVTGLLALSSQDHDFLTQDVIGKLQTISNHLAVALFQEALLGRLWRNQAFAHAIRRSSTAISSTLELSDVLDRILMSIASVVPSDAVSIMLVDGDTARVVRSRGWESRGLADWVNSFKMEFSPGYRLYDILVTQGNRSHTTQDTRIDSEKGWWRFRPENEWILSSAHALIHIDNKPIGIINLDSSRKNHFSHDDLLRLEIFADHVANAVQNAQLYDATVAYSKELEDRVRERTKQLEEANATLKRLAEIKDEFVGSVSHELRTPIANLKLYHHLIAKHPERLSTYNKITTRETERLEKIVENLLLISRIDQDRMRLEITLADLNELVDVYVQDRALLAQEKDITLLFEPETNLRAVHFDEHWLGLSISILLTNAVNYTPEGGTITVKTGIETDEDTQWACIYVSDTGIGIHPEEQERIFERFFRGKSALQTSISGTGLGLSILQDVINNHGGEIDVISEGIPGKGTTFVLKLPAGEAEPS